MPSPAVRYRVRLKRTNSSTTVRLLQWRGLRSSSHAEMFISGKDNVTFPFDVGKLREGKLRTLRKLVRLVRRPVLYYQLL